jgi:hypothetical protein
LLGQLRRRLRLRGRKRLRLHDRLRLRQRLRLGDRLGLRQRLRLGDRLRLRQRLRLRNWLRLSDRLLVLVLGFAGAQRLAELAHAFADGTGELGQAPGAEHDQRHRGEEHEMDRVLDPHADPG